MRECLIYLDVKHFSTQMTQVNISYRCLNKHSSEGEIKSDEFELRASECVLRTYWITWSGHGQWLFDSFNFQASSRLL